MTPSRFAVLAAVILTIQPMAAAASDLVTPYFARTGDKGLPVYGRVLRDGSAVVDFRSEGGVTRYAFDRNGNMTNASVTSQYDPGLLDKVRCPASSALAAAVANADPRETEIRTVMLASEDGIPVYRVYTYDANRRFVGCHRFLCEEGVWDGWNDAVGEEDPVAEPPKKL